MATNEKSHDQACGADTWRPGGKDCCPECGASTIELCTCGADLHGRGKFGGPLAEQYVEQAGGAERDAAFVERIANHLKRQPFGLNRNSATKLVGIARHATNPDLRNAQIAKLWEALELIERLHIPDMPAAYAGDDLSWAQRHVSNLRNIAARVLEETRGGSPRHCTCHPDDNPPSPCPQKFAYTECQERDAKP